MFSTFWHRTLKRPFRLHTAINSGNQSGKPILLIHGLAAESKRTWKPLVDILDHKTWHIIAFDLLGHGKSPAPDFMEYNVTEHSRSLIRQIKRLHLQQPVTIVGHSMGCLIATHIAHTEPKLVDHLVLYEPPLFADSPEFRSHARRKKLYFAIFEYLLARPTVLLRYANFLSRVTRERIAGTIHESWDSFEKSLKNTIMDQQSYNELRSISVKTDIIYGAFDFVVTRNSVKQMLQANQYISFHLVKQPHDVTKRAARYIQTLL